MMKRFEAAFARWVVTHRLIILVLGLLGLVALAAGARHLYFDSSYRVFFSKDNPQLQAFETVERTYTKNDNVVFVVAPDSKQVFSRVQRGHTIHPWLRIIVALLGISVIVLGVTGQLTRIWNFLAGMFK